MQLILGSQSPRRREILSFFNIPFKQVSPDFDEEAVPFHDNPQEYVQILAKGKADSLAHQFPHAVILTADTIVYREGKIYGKPKDQQEAFTFLKELSGRWHSVFTGLTVSCKGEDFQIFEETRVLFNTLTEEQMKQYHQALTFYDKAGGYMIQGAGGLIVKRIEGCYYNVVGLPINALYSVLEQAGIDLWKHFKRQE
jgi:septum formation protein